MKPGEFFGDIRFVGGHEQTIVAVANGDVDAGVTWADGIGDWADGYNSGALRKASDSGIVDMNDLKEIWRSKTIPEGPFVLRKALPERVKTRHHHAAHQPALHGSGLRLWRLAGEALGVQPINHDAYVSIVEARKAASQ
jgi:phosphonate transport system substrate-binding protein